MRYLGAIFITFILFCNSCIEPNEIILGGNSDWVVYGLFGEGEPPIIFIYGVEPIGSQLFYNYAATIVVIDQQSGQQYLLERSINENLDVAGTNEFPFGQDFLGNVVMYTSDVLRPVKGRTYTVNLNLLTEQGTAELTIPASRPFSNVEMVTNNNDVTRITMSIDDDEGDDFYKWEVAVDQTLDLMLSSVDSTTGETIYSDTILEVKNKFLPNNYIDETKIFDQDNIFKFNASANLINYPDNEEIYYLNVRLRHYGKEVVDYFKSIRDQSSGDIYDPFIEPVFIKSNIEGIIGLLGTYSYSEPILMEYQP